MALCAVLTMPRAPQVVPGAFASAGCDAPEPVCAWMDRIVGIKTPNMIASGIVLEDGFIITNRHVVEDHQRILARDKDSGIMTAFPQPHPVPVDLALLRSDGAGGLPAAPDGTFRRAQQLYVVAFDQGRNGARVYQPEAGHLSV